VIPLRPPQRRAAALISRTGSAAVSASVEPAPANQLATPTSIATEQWYVNEGCPKHQVISGSACGR